MTLTGEVVVVDREVLVSAPALHHYLPLPLFAFSTTNHATISQRLGIFPPPANIYIHTNYGWMDIQGCTGLRVEQKRGGGAGRGRKSQIQTKEVLNQVQEEEEKKRVICFQCTSGMPGTLFPSPPFPSPPPSAT